MLNNMPPATTVCNMGNSHSRKAVSFGEFADGCTIGASNSDGSHILFGYFGLGTPRTSAKSSLVNTVTHVVGMSSEKKMFRIDARWIIAMMQYVQSIGYGAEVNHPRCSMGEKVLDLSSALGDLAISGLVGVSRPIPATGFFVDVSPKALTQRGIFVRLITRLAAELPCLAGKRSKCATTF